MRSIVSTSGGRCSFFSQYRTVRSPTPTASAKDPAVHVRPGRSILPPGRVPRSKCQPSSRPKVQRARSSPSFEPRSNGRSFPLFRRAADHFRGFGVSYLPLEAQTRRQQMQTMFTSTFSPRCGCVRLPQLPPSTNGNVIMSPMKTVPLLLTAITLFIIGSGVARAGQQDYPQQYYRQQYHQQQYRQQQYGQQQYRQQYHQQQYNHNQYQYKR